MINKKKVLALIPARRGSKGLPGKNIKQMCGKPLLAWTIEKALLSEYLDCILVSTDCKDIASIARSFGGYVPFLRPEELSSDKSSTFDVAAHALKFLQEKEDMDFEYVVLLEPTSPLREDDDIDKMLEVLSKNRSNFDSIISVGEVDEHPSIVKRLEGSNLESFCPELKQTLRRQDNEAAFFPYGVAYVANKNALLKEKSFYTERCTYFKIKKYQNIEIDDIYGFLCAERIMKYEWGIG